MTTSEEQAVPVTQISRDLVVRFTTRLKQSEKQACASAVDLPFKLYEEGVSNIERDKAFLEACRNAEKIDILTAQINRILCDRPAVEPASLPCKSGEGAEMTAEEHRLEDLKQMAAYAGPVVSFEFREPYYLAWCDHCGWVGSSEHCGSDTGFDDSDVYCPRCQSSGADCGKVATQNPPFNMNRTPASEDATQTREAEGEGRSDAQIVEQANDLAREFYARRGYEVPGGYCFHLATHPHEVEAWDMACLAIETLTGTDAQGAADNLDEAA